MLRARRACGSTPRVRRSARDARYSAISGRRGISWAGAASLAGTGSSIPVRAHPSKLARSLIILSPFFTTFPAHTHRRSAALSFALCCHRATLPICPAAPDGSGGAWSTWHGHEKGASFVWLGPCQPRSHVHQHRMGRIRIGGGFFEKELQCWYITVNDNVKQRELV